jgi:Arc/MetJ family transcription regulator
MSVCVQEIAVRTTLTIDDDLLAEAERLTQITERPALIREALRALIARESARRLAQLGGMDPKAEAPRRRRATP